MSSLSQPSTTYLWSHHIHWCTSECKSLSSPIGSLYDALMDSKPHIKTYMAMESEEPFESSSKKNPTQNKT